MYCTGRSVDDRELRCRLVTFELLDDPTIYLNLDNLTTGSITNGGVVVTLTASDGVLNRTGSGFGVNGTATTGDTDALNANQYIDLVFGQAVTFSSLNVSSWGTNDVGEVQLGSLFESQGLIEGTGDTAYNFLVGEGETVRILATADTGAANGFSIDSFTVAIPEPAGLVLLSVVGSGIWGIRRFFRV